MQAAEAFLDRQQLAALQQQRLGKLLEEVLPRNPFYARKYAEAGLDKWSLQKPADLNQLPWTTKAELWNDQKSHPPYGRNLTYPLARYHRLHQTSGTTGQALRWLDTPESWEQLLQCWETILDVVGVDKTDHLLFPFSFGPFLGFWTAFEAGCRRGCLCLAGGGMSSGARLHLLLENQATVLLCTPTYALRLAEVAREQGILLGKGCPGYAIRALIVAGEPGGSVPATRARIEEAWQARVFDHCGMTEVGPLAIECPENPGGLHLLESHYLAEVIDPESGSAVCPGEVGELVVTTLFRLGSPLIRYRTGDLVRLDPQPCPCGRAFIRLAGGILGRTDNMIHVRGNNVYPSALEDVIRRFPEVAEYRIRVDRTGALAELCIEIEPHRTFSGTHLAGRVSQAIRDELLFRAEVVQVASGTLPRFEMKAHRIQQKDAPAINQEHKEGNKGVMGT